MIKYRTGGWDCYIEEVEVVRETAKQIILLEEWRGKKSERRTTKRGNYHNYFDSWAEARDFLLEKAHSKVQSTEANFEEAMKKRGEIEKLKEPA